MNTEVQYKPLEFTKTPTHDSSQDFSYSKTI